MGNLSIDKARGSNPLSPSYVAFGDSASVDAFGRLRVSETRTIFDSKQTYDSQPLFWDDQETSGSGTSSVHRSNNACTRMSVSADTAGMRVRQTFQSFNYQPGKSQRILATCGNLNAASGNKKGFGYGDGENGLFLVSDGGVLKLVRRTKTSGSPVDVETLVNSRLPNGNTIDLTKTMILDIDFEWLGVGRIRAAFVDAGTVQYFFEYTGTDHLSEVYMSHPTLPIRYWIENDGTGAVDYIDHICSSVMSEGGQEKTGTLRHKESGTISALSNGVKYAAIAIRLQPTKPNSSVEIENISVITPGGNDKAHWELVFNPAVAGTLAYSNESNSLVQTATGDNTNIITGGVEVDGGYITTDLPATTSVPNALKIGADIARTGFDVMVLAIKPITNNISVEASITWRELN